MPINRADIPALIKRSEENRVPTWKKDYFKATCKNLQVHTKGQLFSKVDTLFPNEHPDSKAHCIATYEPITKGSIWKGINNIKRIFGHSSFSYTGGDQLIDWLMAARWEGENLLNYFLELWVSHAVAEDPHGLFIMYPPEWGEEKKLCPVQFVRSEHLQTDQPDFVSFVSEVDSTVRYNFTDTCYVRRVFEDASQGGALNARTFTETTYNKMLEVKVERRVVHLLTTEGLLVYWQEEGNNYSWEVWDFPQTLSQIPYFIGGGTVIYQTDQPLFDSFVAPFIPFGNLSLIQHRNHRAVDLQFSYPRMRELQVPCDESGCQKGKVRCERTPLFPDGWMTCPRCKGSQFVVAQSPYRVYQQRYDPNDQGENKLLDHAPVEFYTPDVGILDYSKDSWKEYLKLGEQAIFVQQQVYTGNVQSAESKGIDLEELYSWLTTISRCFYNHMRTLLQTFEEYLSPNPVPVSVERPYSFAVLTESEAFTALTAILASNAPVFIKADRVENFLSKFVSKDSPVVKAMRILKRFDPLLFYSLADIQIFKGQNVISQQLITRHVLAFPLLQQLFEADPTLFEQEETVVIDLLLAAIDKLQPPPVDDGFRRTLSQISLGDGATP